MDVAAVLHGFDLAVEQVEAVQKAVEADLNGWTGVENATKRAELQAMEQVLAGVLALLGRARAESIIELEQ